ncbi:MAG: cytochrome c oxidase assembly protein [Candidatus Sericytochromatia bacterium]
MPTPPTFHWHLYPLLLSLLLFLGLTYALLWRRWPGENPRQPLYWALGLLTTAGITASPWDQMGHQALFVVRMGETLSLVYVVSCFFLAGLPARWFSLLHSQATGRWLLKWLCGTVTPSAVFNLIFLVWHLPPLYEMTLQSSVLNQLSLVCLPLLGGLMWLPLLSPLKSLRLSFARQMFYVVSLIFGGLPLFALLTFSKGVLYPSYLSAPRIASLSAFADQQLGGWLQKLFTSLVFAGAFIVIFLAWNQRQRRQDLQENQTAVENFALIQRAAERRG